MSTVNDVAATPSPPREHLNIIHPDEGKRYKLNVRTPVARLTIGKVKQCLAAASSCPIPLHDMVLHLNGVPLTSDKDLCASLGIGNGATLSVEARHPLQKQRSDGDRDGGASPHHGARSSTGDVAAPPSSPCLFPMSRQRRLLELQTLQQQDEMLHKDVVVRDHVLQRTLHHAEEEIDQANLRRRQLERQRRSAEEELQRVKEKEAEAARERERLAMLRVQEAERAAERAARLVERREQLRAEQEAARAVAMLKLENEKKKALLAQQRAFVDAERERAQLEQENFEAAAKARELELRAREIDIEHLRLARIREARALELDRRVAVQQRLHYYAQLGVEAPRTLQREAAALLLSEIRENSDDAEEEEDHMGGGRNHSPGALGQRHSSARNLTERKGRTRKADGGALGAKADDLVRSRGSSSPPLSSGGHNATAVATVPDGSFYDARENAEENLRRLGDDLGLEDSLQFDDSGTCIISIDGEYTFLIMYDAATERLYLYSTLLASLPPVVQATAEYRLKLYEFLLEASLLGREMCGGGVGASMRNDFILMSASLYMPTSQPWSLRTLAPQFLHCLRHWRTKLAEFLQGLEAEHGHAQGGVNGAVPPNLPAGAPQPPPHLYTSTSSYPPPPMAHATHHPSSEAAHIVSPHPLSAATSLPLSQASSAAAVSAASLAVPKSLSSAGSAARVVPVLGLEVTGTVLVNGVPTHYEDGVLVVNAAGPSVLAGVQPNDFIEELNGVPIRSVRDFRRVIEEQLRPGMLVPVRISRGGVAMVVTVRVEAACSL
ncbi:hypothetical protein LSCM1_07462 [Leishmania martiniquensis]|uniref:PDZ domain-containing protein n=1 Tax=Leishmania martiniquensis TaxID=1580590 RepID=A0A836KVQ7_9TRYP|nr:hypothetical protein LSCM1_07462 [Leishmania martiniquensis]